MSAKPFWTEIGGTGRLSGSTIVVLSLLRYDLQFKPQPLLATTWTISEDGLRYTFRLRIGAVHADRPWRPGPLVGGGRS